MNEIIRAVGEAFVVICGVAITEFFTGGTVIDSDPAFRAGGSPEHKAWEVSRAWYLICYIFALIILVTLVLRFLIGSRVQLLQEYSVQLNEHNFVKFVTDFCFLMFFGAFIVALAQSKSVRAFMGWLAGISAGGVAWSLIALWRGDARDLPYWWLTVNSVQFLLTSGLSLWCQPFDAKAGLGQRAARWGPVIAGVWFMIIFGFDLQKIILKKVFFWVTSP